MTTIVLEVPDNKSEFIFNLLSELPFTKIKNLVKNEKTLKSKSMKELLKEGYLASNKEDMEITKDFEYIDFVD